MYNMPPINNQMLHRKHNSYTKCPNKPGSPYSKQSFNGKSKNVIYLIVCTTPGCGAQYVGYCTTRCITSRVFEHLNEGPMINHIKQENHECKKIKFQTIAQALTQYLQICRLGMLNNLSNKGLYA